MRSVCFFREKKTVSGYFTVEASLLLPGFLVIQLLLISLSIYTYDRCVMEQCAYEAALQGSSNMFHANEDAYMAAKEAADKLIEGRVFAMDNIESTVKVSATEICVTYRGIVNIPFMTWIAQLETEKKLPRSNQVRAIRIQEFGKELLQYGNQ